MNCLMFKTLLGVTLLSAQLVYAKERGECGANGSWSCCQGQCEIGEGDCDNHSDCLDGLKCDYDWFFGADHCIAGPDTKNYEWAAWGDWSECSISCGGQGEKKRTRTCIPPVKGGDLCPSESQTQTATCDTDPCPVDGGWGQWSEWGECSVTCGGGEHGRTRSCDSPAPQHGGAECTADGSSGSESEACNADPCPIDGGWGQWSDWGECSVSCGGGEHGRARSCDSPAPQHGGAECTADGSSGSESEACNADPCPIDGGWGQWSDWDECTASCGGGEHGRTRSCDSPAPQHGGADCAADGSSGSESEACNPDPCPINGVWGSYGDWGECSVTCGGGQAVRSRPCESPKHGGLDCNADGSSATESKSCNTNSCYRYGCEANRMCKWDHDKANVDWGYFSKTEGDCAACQTLCDSDDNCGAVECNDGYCSWWKVGLCPETTKKSNTVTTCRKFPVGTCITDSGPKTNQACVFPFTYGSTTYNKCTSVADDQPWCATSVSDTGNYQGGKWGNCEDSCPTQA